MIEPIFQHHVALKRSVVIAFIIFSSMVMTAACNIGLPPPPTPGPFPVEGVQQITSDYAFYKDLTWSPDGQYIAATRCPVENYAPRCLGNEEPLLIKTGNLQINTIDLQSITSNRITGYPITWLPGGQELLLVVEERISQEGSTSPESVYRKMIYNVVSETFSEIEIIWRIIAFSQDGSKFLITRSIDDDTLALGWHVTETSEFIEELRYPLTNSFLGPYALSPDQHILLQSDSSLTSSCNEVQAYIMGSLKPFEPLLSLACYPAWSPGGSKLAYTAKASSKDLPNRLMITDADGSNPVSLFIEPTPHELAYPTWSADGHQIAFTFGGLSGANAIYIVDVPEHLQSKSVQNDG